MPTPRRFACATRNGPMSRSSQSPWASADAPQYWEDHHDTGAPSAVGVRSSKEPIGSAVVFCGKHPCPGVRPNGNNGYPGFSPSTAFHLVEIAMTSRLRIIVTGLVGLYPVGGVAWDYLQYVIGLARLGHDVYYHEDTWSWPDDPIDATYTSDGDYSARYLERFFARHAPELRQRWHYLHLHETSFGMERAAFDEAGPDRRSLPERQRRGLPDSRPSVAWMLEGLPGHGSRVQPDHAQRAFRLVGERGAVVRQRVGSRSLLHLCGEHPQPGLPCAHTGPPLEDDPHAGGRRSLGGNRSHGAVQLRAVDHRYDVECLQRQAPAPWCSSTRAKGPSSRS